MLKISNVKNIFLSGNKNAGNFSELPKITTLLPCIASCCQLKDKCNVAFIFNETCYQVQCTTNDLCIPSRKPNVTTKLQLVLVNPVTEGYYYDTIFFIEARK